MLDVKINDTVFKLPLAWEEVTLEQFIRLYDVAHDTTLEPEYYNVAVAAALLGIKLDVLKLANAKEVNDKVVANIQWANEPPAPPTACNDLVFIGGKEYKLPVLEHLNVGQIVELQRAVRNNMYNTSIKPEAFPLIIAIGFCSNPYDDDALIAVKSAACDMPFYEASPLVSFFLSALPGLPKTKVRRSLAKRMRSIFDGLKRAAGRSKSSGSIITST